MSKQAVLIVGSLAFDTLHIAGKTYPRVLGGAAVYASLAASQLGAVRLVGVVGQDFPDSAVEMLRTRGIDMTGLSVAPGKTFHWEGEYNSDMNQRKTLKTELNVFADFKPSIPSAFADSEYVLLANIDPILQMSVLEQVGSPKFVAVDTMNYWINTRLTELKVLLESVDLLVINEEEARMLSGKTQPIAVVETLLELGPESVVVKRGEYGAFMASGDELMVVPGFPLRHVQDPTGAGDTFAGGMVGYLASVGKSDAEHLRRAAIYGSALASLCVEGIGTSALEAANANQIDQRVQAFQRLVAF